MEDDNFCIFYGSPCIWHMRRIYVKCSEPSLIKRWEKFFGNIIYKVDHKRCKSSMNTDYKIGFVSTLTNLKNIQYHSTYNWSIVKCKIKTKIVSFVGQIWLFYFMEDDNFCIFYGSPCIIMQILFLSHLMYLTCLNK